MNNYVGFWRRFVGYFIDIFIAGSTIIMLANMLTENSAYSPKLVNLISFIVSGLYFILFWAFQNGQTLGARLLKFRVVNENMTSLAIGGAILRYFGFIISAITLGLGFLWVAFDKRKQGLHDKIAKTLVVSTGTPSFIIVLLTFLGLGIMYSLFMSAFVYQTYQGLQTDNRINVTTLTDNQVNSMSIVAFSKANEQRKQRDVAELKLDNRLCAYAQRRLDQLDESGKLDDGRGFYEDTANPEMQNAYFSENPMTGELSRKMSSLDFEEEGITAVIDSWAKVKDSNLVSPSFKNGCIRANKNFMVFILGGTEK